MAGVRCKRIMNQKKREDGGANANEQFNVCVPVG